MELPSSQTLHDGLDSLLQQANLLPGENRDDSFHQDTRDTCLDKLLQDSVFPNCEDVWDFAAPRTTFIRMATSAFSSAIAEDLESLLLKAATGKSNSNDQLDAWVMDILDWTGFSAPSVRTTSRSGINSAPKAWSAVSIRPRFESFVLFVAHHVNAYIAKHSAAGRLRPEDCRLILPITKEDEDTDAEYARYANDPKDLARVTCGMFPFGTSVVRQAVPAPHLVVTNAAIASDPNESVQAMRNMAKDAKVLYFRQHNRRFAWGLTVSCRTVRAHVFGTGSIWPSNDIDVASAAGRLALISLLVDWSLCSVDRLGFDPSIRYAHGSETGCFHLEIDVHKKDASTREVTSRTYYSSRCVVAADGLTGRHTRHFAASASVKTMDQPTVLIKDIWVLLNSSRSDDTRDESAVLNTLHDLFGGDNELKDKFPQLVSTGPVYLHHGDRFVVDTTATAFARLPTIYQVDTLPNGGDYRGLSDRQHKRVVLQWGGDMISAATNSRQVIIAIADAMAALNTAYNKRRILHCHISEQAILFRETADGVVGSVAEFGYATYRGGRIYSAHCEMPEQIAFQSILSLERPLEFRTRLEDWESLLYLVCWLGTFGVGKAERDAFVANPPKALAVKYWSADSASNIALAKRNHISSLDAFMTNIADAMCHGPLRNLAIDLYRALFLHPGCSGAFVRDNLPPIVAMRDPLAHRNTFESQIVANLQNVLAKHKAIALGEQSTTPTGTRTSLGRHLDKAPEYAVQRLLKTNN
ncbi:hypothetical protein GGI20_000195 [Coemansia sp. BCRC 34301]|nr:hypothetical protein GGI20_000195 [Coemansia sp. BCRC 34301]